MPGKVRSFALALILALVLVVPVEASGPACRFVLGFAALQQAIPAVVGSCVDDQISTPNGDALQHTTNGLLVWNKSDNLTSFTDGYRTWVSGPYGVEQRLNTERFSWESGAPTAPLPVVPPSALGSDVIGFTDVPPYAQHQMSSCEAAAASVALRLLGVPTSEEALLMQLPVDARPPVLGPDGRVLRWGDPDVAFVGNVNGPFPWNKRAPTAVPGYGVYAGPLLTVVRRFDPRASGGIGVPTSSLLDALRQGRPSVVWLPDQWNYRSLPDATRTDTWLSWSGKPVTYAYREHAQVLLGHSGEGYIVGNVGYQETRISFINIWPDAEFAAGYAVLGNMAITV